MASKNYGAVPTEEEGGSGAGGSKSRGIELPDDSRPTCRNPIFALLFIGHLVVVALLGIRYGSFAVPDEIESATKAATRLADLADRVWGDEDEEDGGGFDDESDGLISPQTGEFLRSVIVHIALPCGAIAFVLAYGIAAFVLPWSTKGAVRTCLLLSFFVTVGLLGSVCYHYQRWWMYAISGVLSLMALVYTVQVWHVVPFAAANLKVAIRGMTENGGTYVIALFFSCLAFVWGVGWFYVANGVYELKEVYGTHHLCDAGDGDVLQNVTLINGLDCEQTRKEAGAFGGIMFALLVSFYWTISVILNTVRVTVAGVMGTWCIDKDDAASCCSPAVTSSLVRSLFFSLGSICFGSFLEGLASAINAATKYGKKVADSDGDAHDCGSRFMSFMICCTKCCADALEFFNQWAYVYIGVYGYGYVKSGKKVMELFKSRGWTSITSNFLVSYVLNFTSLIVASVTGGIAIALDNNKVGIEGYWDSFVVGFLVGFCISHVMMNVIKGAVNTAIVCFADKPDEMARNHPVMMKEMAEAWLDVYPDCGVTAPTGGMYDVVV